MPGVDRLAMGLKTSRACADPSGANDQLRGEVISVKSSQFGSLVLY
jgi:hypothetical protein